MAARDAVRTETAPLLALIDAANIAQRGLELRLGHLKLGVSQLRILALVYYATESLTPSMLASLLLIEKQSVSGLLNRLEDRDLITRTHDKQNRRVVSVDLTPPGRNVAEEAIQIHFDLSQEFKKIFETANIDALLDMLHEVRDIGFLIAGVHEHLREQALRRVWG